MLSSVTPLSTSAGLLFHLHGSVYKEHKPCDILDPSLGLQLWCSRFYVQAHRQLWHAEYKQHNTCIKKWQTWSHFNQSSDHNTVGDGCLRSLPFGRDGIKLSDSHTHTLTHTDPRHLCSVFACDGSHLRTALTRRTFTLRIPHTSLQTVHRSPRLLISLTDSSQMFGLLDKSESAICQINNSQKQTTGLSDEEAEGSKLEKLNAGERSLVLSLSVCPVH